MRTTLESIVQTQRIGCVLDRCWLGCRCSKDNARRWILRVYQVMQQNYKEICVPCCNIYFYIKIWGQKQRQLKMYPSIIPLDSILSSSTESLQIRWDTAWASSPRGTITYWACNSASRLASSAAWAAEALAFKGPDPSAHPFSFWSPEMSCIQS